MVRAIFALARPIPHSNHAQIPVSISVSLQSSSLRKLIPFGNRVLVKRVEAATKVRYCCW